jgi:hypothetical protein
MTPDRKNETVFVEHINQLIHTYKTYSYWQNIPTETTTTATGLFAHDLAYWASQQKIVTIQFVVLLPKEPRQAQLIDTMI